MLADDILQQMDRGRDRYGAIKDIEIDIISSQRFVLSDDFTLCVDRLVQGKPSSLYKAMSLVGAPYDITWVEWNNYIRDCYKDSPRSDFPQRCGCLIRSKFPKKGSMTFVMSAPKNDVDPVHIVLPIGIEFDFEHPFSDGLRIGSDDELKHIWTKTGDPWVRFIDRAEEIEAVKKLAVCYRVKQSRHFDLAAKDFGNGFMDEFQAMVAGLPNMIFAILVMLNSKTSVEREAVERPHKGRAVRGKRALLDYCKTRIQLTKAQRERSERLGLTREEARYHLVRGHPKVRKTGVFWWSSFPRGNPTNHIDRDHYRVSP